MGDRVSKILEAFAEAVAAAGPQPGAIKANGTFLYVHCPFPGPTDDPHQAKGEPGVSLWLKDGEPVAHCRKCLGPTNGFHDPAELAGARQRYTDELKMKTGWRPQEKRDTEELRHHNYYDRNLRHVVDHKKVRYNGELKFFWDAAPLDSELKRTERFHSIRAEEFLAEHHPDFDHIYEALHWYGIEALIDEAGTIPFGPLLLRKPEHIAICEGERDCDTFNALGLKGWFATCLSHPKPSALRAHHLPLIKGATVYIVPDKDTAGIEQANNWADRIWDHCPRILQVNLPLLGGKGKKDLTDWVEAGGTAEQLLQLLMEAEAWINRPVSAEQEQSALRVGLAVVRTEYQPTHRTVRGFYSQRYECEVTRASLDANEAILEALKGCSDIPRDNLGKPKRRAEFKLWADTKSAIFGELKKQLHPEHETQSRLEAAEALELHLANLFARMVTLNYGAGEQRHAIGSWACRYATMPLKIEDAHSEKWRQVKTYPIWGNEPLEGIQIAFRPELVSAVGWSSPIQMPLMRLHKLCLVHGFCEERSRITCVVRNPKDQEQEVYKTIRAIVLTSSFVAGLSLSVARDTELGENLSAGISGVSPQRGETPNQWN